MQVLAEVSSTEIADAILGDPMAFAELLTAMSKLDEADLAAMVATYLGAVETHDVVFTLRALADALDADQ